MGDETGYLVIFTLEQPGPCYTTQMHACKQEKEESFGLSLPPKLQIPLTTFYGYITNDKARQTFPSQLLISLFLLAGAGGGNVCRSLALGLSHDAELSPIHGCDLQGNQIL